MGYSTLNCLFLLLSCILVNFRLNTAQSCFNGTNSTSSSQYGVNRNKILSSLASTVRDNGGFYTGHEGEGSDTVYALGLCRGELDSENCFSCINSSSHAIIENYPCEKEATDFGQSSSCIVRCSDKSIGSINDISTARFVYSLINITDNADEFDQALSSLVDSLVDTAADSTVPRSKFAKDTKKFSEYQTIYAIMECIPNLTPSHCRDCLRQAVSYYSSYCTRKKGVIVLLPSCIFQYDLDPFFEVQADASLSAPPPVDTYAPSTPLTMITKQDKKSRKLRTAIIVVAPTSITLLLIGSTFFLLRKRIRNSKTDIPSNGDGSIGLPIFNVATINSGAHTNTFKGNR